MKEFLEWIENLSILEKGMMYLMLSTTIVFIGVILSGLAQEFGLINIW